MVASSSRAAVLIRKIRAAGSIEAKGESLWVSPKRIAEKYRKEITELKPAILEVLGDLCPVCGGNLLKEQYEGFIYLSCPSHTCRGFQKLTASGEAKTLKGVFTSRLKEWCKA